MATGYTPALPPEMSGYKDEPQCTRCGQPSNDDEVCSGCNLEYALCACVECICGEWHHRDWDFCQVEGA